jgi:hypothetical protein
VFGSTILIALFCTTSAAEPTSTVAPDIHGAAEAVSTATASNGRHLLALRIHEPIELDGKLDEAAWSRAPESRAFTQKFPNEGDAPTERTTMRVLYDDHALYIGFECDQIGSPVIERLTRRGRQVEADWVSVDIGTRRDRKSAFEFMVNASGVLNDGLRFNDVELSPEWDENWDARTQITARGWTVEIMIPLRILRFDSLPIQSWDFQARRYISMRQETDEWAFIPRDTAGEVSHYGQLDALEDLESATPLELRPFALASARRRDTVAGQVIGGTGATFSAGADLKWHPTQALTFDATFFPDFAQVEADQVILNLTKFETYYPEHRPFFLEGLDTLATPMQLLYTRRIGHAPTTPTLRTESPFGEQLVDFPTFTPIYGAAKLTGRLSERWAIGAVEAVTGRNDVDVQLQDGSRARRLVDPLTSYSFVRLRRDLGDNGDLGLTTAITARADSTSAYPLLSPTTELCPNGNTYAPGTRCFNNAYVAAADWRLRWGGGDWVTGGQGGFSMLQGGPPRLVLDGTVNHPGDLGFGVVGYVAKEGGEHWVGDVYGEYNNRTLDVNDLGFDRRANNWRWRLDLEYRELKRWWIFLETHLRFEYFARFNDDGVNIGSGYQLNLEGKLDNRWWFFTEVHWRPKWYDDREVGDGTALQRAGLMGYELELSSDPTRIASFKMDSQTQILTDGFNISANAGVVLRIHPQLDLEVLPTVRYTFGEPRYIGNGPTPGEYLFGDLRAKAYGAVLRATYTFTPRLTLQTYAQLFLASEHYSRRTSFQSDPMGARPVIHLSDLVETAQAPALTISGTSNPDLEEGVLNVNVILRWEFELGSTVFLVYTRSQFPNVLLMPQEPATLTWHAVRRSPAADAVLLKVAYWFGL